MKRASLIFLGLLTTFAATSVIASEYYDDIPLTQGQIKFIKLTDKQMKTKFSTLINTPNANRIITAATFACDHIDFQKKVVLAAGRSKTDSIKASKTFETLFCGHLIIKGH